MVPPALPDPTVVSGPAATPGAGTPAWTAAARRVDALQRQLGAERRETAISWLLLTADTVYKFAQPVDRGYLDFTRAEARRDNARAELRLNRRLAPGLYRRVVAVHGPDDAPWLGPDAGAAADGDAPAAAGIVDHGVEMRRFPDGALMGEQLRAGTLSRAHLQAFALRLADAQAVAPPADPLLAGDIDLSPAAVLHAAAAVVERLAARGVAVAPWRHWLQQQAADGQAAFDARSRAGAVCEGHGDLHLGNLALLDGEPVAFDALAFNPALRWFDRIGDPAFLLMDLIAHGRADLGWAFLDAWLQAGGDHGGLAVLRVHLVYRALVRALVAAEVQARRPAPGAGTATLPADPVGPADPDYLAVATDLARPTTPRLLITHGLSGSGKSTVTQRLLEAAGAVRLRSDVERKRLFGLRPLQSSIDAVPGGAALVYGADATAATFDRLAALAGASLDAGWPTVVDAAFLRRAERDRFAALADRRGMPFTLLHCHADDAVLEERLRQRQALGRDPSEATVEVLRHQRRWVEPLGADEMPRVLRLSTEGDVDVAAVVRHWR